MTPKSKTGFRFKTALLPACAVFVSAVLISCTPKTDFDRPTQSINGLPYNRSIEFHAAPNNDARISNFKYTQQEIAMRNLGYRLTEAHGRGGRSYYRRLKNGPGRTDYSMWTQLNDDIRADEVSTLRFIPAMQRVLQTDHERHQVFLSRGQLDPEELQNLSARLTENENFATLVLNSLENRIFAYRDAIDRAEVEVPSDRVHELKYAIADLDQLSREFKGALNRDYASAPSRVATRPLSHDVIDAPIFDYNLQ